MKINLKKVGNIVGRVLTSKPTYLVAAAIATAVGAGSLVVPLNTIGALVPLIVGHAGAEGNKI